MSDFYNFNILYAFVGNSGTLHHINETRRYIPAAYNELHNESFSSNAISPLMASVFSRQNAQINVKTKIEAIVPKPTNNHCLGV